MTIGEMHVWFRQYAQQMGMQNVRAILPEQIDLLINTSITDTVNQLIKENIGITNDRVITDNSKIGQINALRSLYTVKEIDCFSSPKLINKDEARKMGTFDGKPIKQYYKVDYENNVKTETIPINTYCIFIEEPTLPYLYKTIQPLDVGGYGSENHESITMMLSDGVENEYLETVYNKTLNVFSLNVAESKIGKLSANNIIKDYTFLIDFAINYQTASKGISENSSPVFDNKYRSNYFPIRLIDDAYLADALNDFVLKNRLRSPILTIYNDVNKKLYFDLYIDEFKKGSDNTYYLNNNLIPYKFRISYIAKPVKVEYSEDVNGNNRDCNLPESMHIDILKHAVDLYRIAVTGSLSASQQSEQNQQRENARNNYRNEGTNQQQ